MNWNDASPASEHFFHRGMLRGNRVVSMGTPGIAAQDPPNGKQASLEYAVDLEGLYGVL